MIILDINSDDTIKYEKYVNLIQTATGVRCIIINNELHIIGGYGNDKHLKWNNERKKLETLHDMNMEINWQYRGHPSLVRVQNKILVFGGHPTSGYSHDMHEYDILIDTWENCNTTMPFYGCSFGVCAVLNNQYILLFGGAIMGASSDAIWIYNVKDQTFTKSDIKCPVPNRYQAFAVCDVAKDQMTVFGYIRREWMISKIDQHLFPPEYLIRIMGKYYLNEEVHLTYFYGTLKDKEEHWKIDVLDIFSSA